jgi:hypothetical protein
MGIRRFREPRAVIRITCGLAVQLAIGSLLGSPGLAGEADAKPDSAQLEFFETRVRPVLVANCFECHGPSKHKSDLRLDSREAILKGGETGPAIVPGKPQESLLVEAIRYDGSLQMPPRGRLTKEEVAALSEWVKQGALWPQPRHDLAPRQPVDSSLPAAKLLVTAREREFWSFRPISDPLPPSVHDTDWPRSSIDRFILSTLEAAGLKPSPPADKRTLMRRVSFDLLGLPPAPQEIDAFLADNSPEAFARVVDRLLASPHYGERWGRHWLDLARYGEDQAHSFQPRLYPYGFRYRDWLIKALNRDMPYDRFLLEQLAGDLLAEPGRQERLAALGFFALGPVYYGDAKQLDQYADRIDTLSRAVLGLTVACARCHDHKYDPIPTSDYYALAGVFASTEYVEAPCAPKEQVEAYEKAQGAVQKKTQELNAYLKAEADRLKLKVPRTQIEKNLPAESRNKAVSLRKEVEKLKKAMPAKYPVIHTLADAKEPRNMKVLVRGNPETPGTEVPRRFLTVLGGDSQYFTQGSGRLELAEAIANPANPLTARVMVNRVWQHHFGRGLVATASNFGALGERPTHPELLEWLASRFMAKGWSLKTLHREIVLSATYQQSCGLDDRASEIDPANTLLWRMNRRRLEVEPWRDAMLAVSGRLDSSVGGPSVKLETGANCRRTCYAAISRHDLAPLLRLFDFPDPNITSGGRVETTVPLQQLFVLNSEFMVQTARALVGRLQTESPAGDDSARIRLAYLWLYGRPATPREIATGVGYLQTGASQADMSRWERYAQVLLAANEFAYVD